MRFFALSDVDTGVKYSLQIVHLERGVLITERGIYAASISPDISTLKRAKGCARRCVSLRKRVLAVSVPLHHDVAGTIR